MNNTKQYDIEIIVNKKLKHSYISISQQKKVLIKTPYKSEKFIDSLLSSKRSWIEKKLQQIESREHLQPSNIHSLNLLVNKVEYFSKLMALDFTQLKFRKMRRRWGSCSSKCKTVTTRIKKYSDRTCLMVTTTSIHLYLHLQRL